ncbi:MAG: hypothetical protein ACI9SY_000373 [Candidatus Paceibacteria bacterium]|jgi:hypothetical protein
MSELPAHKKGMRTFASDFERVKGTTSKSANIATENVTVAKLKNVPKPVTKITNPDKLISRTIQEPATPKKIPAFHEIEKNLKDIDLSDKETKKKSHKAKSTKSITPTRRVGGGAIITDTKTSSFSLFGESKKSISSWFKARKKKATPKLAVPKADRRRGVIQQASTKSGTIFTADSATLKERIAARKLQEKNKPADPETNWSPYTETGYSLLESGADTATDNVVVEFKKRSIPVAVEPKPVAETEIQQVSTQEIISEAAAEPVINEIIPEIERTESEADRWVEQEQILEESVSTDQQAAVVHTPVEEKVVEKETVQSELPESVVETEHAVEEGTTLTTNQLTLYISSGLALVLVTGFFGWFVMNGMTNPSESNDPQIDQFITQAQTDVVTVDQTFTTATLLTYTGTSLYTEIVLQNSDKQLLPTALIFELVAPDMPTAIKQFATDVRFVQLGIEVPQMMIGVADPTSVIGTLLMHETELITALTPLYGKIDQGEFIDITIAGTDARVLVSGTRQTLTYGIINEQTLLITISPDTFAEIGTLLSN